MSDSNHEGRKSERGHDWRDIAIAEAQIIFLALNSLRGDLANHRPAMSDSSDVESSRQDHQRWQIVPGDVYVSVLLRMPCSLASMEAN